MSGTWPCSHILVLDGSSSSTHTGTYFRTRLRNAYMLIAATGLAICTCFAIIVLIVPVGTNIYLIAILLLCCQTALWAHIGQR